MSEVLAPIRKGPTFRYANAETSVSLNRLGACPRASIVNADALGQSEDGNSTRNATHGSLRTAGRGVGSLHSYGIS